MKQRQCIQRYTGKEANFMGIIKASKLIYDYIRRDEDDHVEDTGDGRCSQFDFAHTPEEGSVRHTYQLLHKEAD